MRRPAPFATALTATLTAFAAALALATPVAAEDAPRWQRVPDMPPVEVEACGTTVTVDEELNRMRELVTMTEDGMRIRTRGLLTYRVTTPDGRAAVVDASGPADIRISGDTGDIVLRGANLLMATDERLAALHDEAGLPRLALTMGRVHLRDRVDEETGELLDLEFVSLPRPGRRIVDVCTLLVRGSV